MTASVYAPSSPRRLLIVATAPDPEDELAERVRRFEGQDVELLVVAPASDVSFLQWLTSDEDRVRQEAARRAERVVGAVPADVVETRVGDVDPLTAVEDALRTFPANHVILVTRPDEAAAWIEKGVARAVQERLGLPVTHVVDDDVDVREVGRSAPAGNPKVEELIREVVSGRSPWTGFFVQNAVFLIVLTAGGIVIAVVLAIYLGLR